MRKKIKGYDNGTAYLGNEATAEGYIGEMDALFNAVTIVIVKPGTDLKSIKQSLQITIQDIDLRIQQEGK